MKTSNKKDDFIIVCSADFLHGSTGIFNRLQAILLIDHVDALAGQTGEITE